MPANGQLSALAFATVVACAFARPDIHYGTTKTGFTASKGAQPIINRVKSADESNALMTATPVPTALNKVPEAVIVDQDQPELKVHHVQLEKSDISLSSNGKIDFITPYYDNGNSVNVIPKSEEESQQSELFRDVSKPVNQRFPYAVLFGGTCGGSIISPKWVLTAGHCTLFTGGRYILAGTGNSADGSGVRRRVKKLYIHPLFTVGPYWVDAEEYNIKQVAARWDFLLAELDQPLELDGVTIAAIPLNDEVDVTPETFVGYAGYGTDHHGGYMRSVMHAMDLKIKPDQTCKKLTQFNNNDMLCAQGYKPNFNSACNGDSGSGLIGNGKLVGVASWVENDAIECKPGNVVVFSKVAAVRDWIRQVANV